MTRARITSFLLYTHLQSRRTTLPARTRTVPQFDQTIKIPRHYPLSSFNRKKSLSILCCGDLRVCLYQRSGRKKMNLLLTRYHSIGLSYKRNLSLVSAGLGDKTPLLEQIAATIKRVDASTIEPRNAQVQRIDMTIRFCLFAKETLPAFVSRGLTRHRHPLDQDPLSSHDVPALAERLKLFLTPQGAAGQGKNHSDSPVARVARKHRQELDSYTSPRVSCDTCRTTRPSTPLRMLQAGLASLARRKIRYSHYHISNHIAHLSIGYWIQSGGKHLFEDVQIGWEG